MICSNLSTCHTLISYNMSLISYDITLIYAPTAGRFDAAILVVMAPLMTPTRDSFR